MDALAGPGRTARKRATKPLSDGLSTAASGLFEWLGRAEGRFEITRPLANRRNAIVMYHAVGDPERYGNVSVERFARDLQYLRDRFEIVDLPDVLSRPERGPKRIAITFDDAYRNFHRHALPVIRALDVPVTVFVPTAFLDGANDDLAYRFALAPDGIDGYNELDRDRSPDSPTPGVMSTEQLHEIAAEQLVTVGNHTRTHPDLARIHDHETLDAEIVAAQTNLRDRFGVDADRFCFPYGRYSETALDVVRDTHRYAVTTEPNLLSADADPYRLPRIRAHVPEHEFRWALTDLHWSLADRFG